MRMHKESVSRTASRPPDQHSQSFFTGVQTKLAISKPGDKHEQEADRMADRVMRMPSSETRVIHRSVSSVAPTIQRASSVKGPPASGIVSDIRSRTSGGSRLDDKTRAFMESRFQADFGNVRVHNDTEAARLSSRLSARAFATGNHIFFNRGEYRPETSSGRHLLAHELTHTIQQGAAVQRSVLPGVTASPPAIQRWGIGDAMDYFADKALLLPGFRMLTVIIGINPVNMSTVDRSAANIIRALFEMIPFGSLISSALERHGIFQRAGTWVAGQFASFRSIGGQMRSAINNFLSSLSWSDVLDLGGVWERAKAIFTDPITRIIDFGEGLVSGLLDLAREAILKPLAGLVKDTRGYDLLCAILGRDPITGQPVARSAETLIGGFMKLIGREDIWENIQKGNAIQRAWTWFQRAIGDLQALVLSVPTTIVQMLQSITWEDVLSLVGVVERLISVFTGLVRRFFSWAGGTILQLLEIIFSVVAPGVMPFMRRAAGAFQSILQNPVGFIGNLVRAGRMGFQMFARNIASHLRTALIRWITGPLGEAGVYIPTSFDLFEIIKMVLSVLGLTWQNIRSKLVRIIPEPVLVVLERTAGILVTFVKDGPAAAWQQIRGELNELRGMLISQVVELVSTEIVKAAVTKIVSMFNPAGAVIQAIMAIYNTVMFVVERLSQIAATVAAFVDSIAAIASGQVQAAAQRVETTLANTLVLVISFLARLVGLGGIPGKLVGIVRRIRAPIDRGLDRIVAWLGEMLKRLGATARRAVGSVLQWWKKKVPVNAGGETHNLMFEGEGSAARFIVRSKPEYPENFVVKYNPPDASMNLVSAANRKVELRMRKLEALRSSNPVDNAAVEKEQMELQSEMAEVGKLIDAIAGKGRLGSATNPMPINYPKRRASAYEPIYVGPRADVRVRQTDLREAFKMSNKDDAKEYVLSRTAGLSKKTSWDGTIRKIDPMTGDSNLGVGLRSDIASLDVGRILLYTVKGSTGGGGKINRVFAPFGFKPISEELDGDHVLERQLGGPDELFNLWPLKASENRSSGATLKDMRVKYGKSELSVHDAGEKFKVSVAKPMHLLVRTVRV